MAGFKDMGTGARSALLAGGALIAAVAGYGLWSVNQAPPPGSVTSDARPAAASTTTIATAPPAADSTANTVQTEPTPDPTAAASVSADPVAGQETQTAAPVVPTFDLVRVEPDGQALVAGQAAPGAKVALRLDGEELSATTADVQGNFVVLFVLDPSPLPRMLTMAAILPDMTEIPASAEIALAPTAAPVAVTAPASPPEPIVTAEADEEPAADASPAIDAPAALSVTKDGVNLLPTVDQPALTEGQTQLALDTISYTPSGEVQLAGRAAAGSVMRVYLDNAPLIDLPVGEDGRWASTMPMIAPGIYTLRIDELSADGTVTARFETPFKRETQEALAAATQTEDPAPETAPDVTAAEPQSVAAPAAKAALAPVIAEAAPPAGTSSVVPAPVVPADQGDAAEIATNAEPGPAAPLSITVQPGFTLWGIASEQFGDGVLYVQVFEANKDKIRDPNLIYPGQVFVIPTGSE